MISGILSMKDNIITRIYILPFLLLLTTILSLMPSSINISFFFPPISSTFTRSNYSTSLHLLPLASIQSISPPTSLLLLSSRHLWTNIESLPFQYRWFAVDILVIRVHAQPVAVYHLLHGVPILCIHGQ